MSEELDHVLDWQLLSQQLLPREKNAYKGDFGHVLVIGGDYGMGGSVRLAAEAVLRVGAGLVSVATRAEQVAAVTSVRPEIMCHDIFNANDLLPLLKKASVILCGTGLGQSAWSKNLFEAVLQESKPTVLDADALNLLAQNPQKKSHWILTPHPGEAARLLRSNTAEIQHHRQESIQHILENYGGTVVLKGAGTIVQSENSAPAFCHAGNPGMATAGMGDVLSGVIAGLLAQHFLLLDAAKIGVMLHAKAADLAARESGERGMIATDLMPFIRRLANPVNSVSDQCQ